MFILLFVFAVLVKVNVIIRLSLSTFSKLITTTLKYSRQYRQVLDLTDAHDEVDTVNCCVLETLDYKYTHKRTAGLPMDLN